MCRKHTFPSQTECLPLDRRQRGDGRREAVKDDKESDCRLPIESDIIQMVRTRASRMIFNTSHSQSPIVEGFAE